MNWLSWKKAPILVSYVWVPPGSHQRIVRMSYWPLFSLRLLYGKVWMTVTMTSNCQEHVVRTCGQGSPCSAEYKQGCFIKGAHLTDARWEPQSRDCTLRRSIFTTSSPVQEHGNPRWSKPTSSEWWGNLRPKTMGLSAASVPGWATLCLYAYAWLHSRAHAKATSCHPADVNLPKEEGGWFF